MTNVDNLNINNSDRIFVNVKGIEQKKQAMKKMVNEEQLKTVAEQEIRKRMEEKYSKRDIEKLLAEIKRFNNRLSVLDKKVLVNYNSEIGRIILTVVNKTTNEVIQEYPCEELQKLAKQIKEMTGVFLDKEV